MLKTELHTHCNADPIDYKWVKYSPKDLVNEAIKKKFDVLAITCHNLVYTNKELKEYARKKGLLLLFGIERDIEERHTLLYNITQKEAMKINTFQDLKRAKETNKNLIAISAHPLYPGPACIGKKGLIKHQSLFDAWEHSFFHSWFYNPNRKLIKLAKKYKKPLVGNSDVHVLKDLGRTYSLINSKKTEEAVFQAIKDGKVKVVTNEVPIHEFLHIAWKFCLSVFRKRILPKLAKS